MKTTKHTGALFSVFLLLFIGAVLWLFAVAEDYYNYTVKTIEGAAHVVPLDKESMRERLQPTEVAYDTEVKYRKFFLTTPQATQVELQGDFNRWGKDPIILRPYKKGYFETSVALAGGEYKYIFVVDGKDVLDPSNQDRQTLANGREVCIKTVR